MPENLVSRDGLSRPVPRQPAHFHTQAKSGAYLRDSSRVPRRCPTMYVCMYVCMYVKKSKRGACKHKAATVRRTTT